MPKFPSLEYQAKDPDNLIILRTCRCSWVRNKDIAQATGMTPAGAKRRNGFLEGIGLLERRRRGKEVQYCTTILAYLANLDLVVEEPLAALGVVRTYLYLTKEHNLRVLKDVGSLQQPSDGVVEEASPESIEREFLELRETLATIAYIWPLEIVSKLLIDLEGFNRSGATILQANRMAIPIPILTSLEFESIAEQLEEMAKQIKEQHGPGFDVWKEISMQFLTGQAQVTDYQALRNLIESEQGESRNRANQHYTMLCRFAKILDDMRMKGVLHAPIKKTLDEILEDAQNLGLVKVEIPENVPIGIPRFNIIPKFNEKIKRSRIGRRSK